VIRMPPRPRLLNAALVKVLPMLSMTGVPPIVTMVVTIESGAGQDRMSMAVDIIPTAYFARPSLRTRGPQVAARQVDYRWCCIYNVCMYKYLARR
jgi:hypothetical protein